MDELSIQQLFADALASHRSGQLARAEAIYRQAIALKPEFVEAHNNLGMVLMSMGRFDEAIAAFERTVSIKPNYAEALSNLGNLFKDSGRLDDALACFDRAFAANPTIPGFLSNRLYTLYFHPDFDDEKIFRWHQQWNKLFAQPLKNQIIPHPNDRSPDRRIRIGYVSPNFGIHVVGRFLLPLFANHDHRQFEICCYSSVAETDEITDRLRSRADLWREVHALSDEQLAGQIRRDKIDILIDLSLHMAGHRLLVFARKPAPIQMTYLAYAGTSGLDAMDYRLTDPHLDPLKENNPFYSEQSIHLPRTYWCYEAGIATPESGPLPAAKTGRITFGCFNNYCKVTSATWSAWARLLAEVPQSDLVVHASSGSHRDRARRHLQSTGIDPHRLSFADKFPMQKYFQQYQNIDIALDPFPYGGGTTSCDAMWMGVPVITLRGRTAVGRGGVSLLENLNLPEFIANDLDEYVRIIAKLAGDLPRLTELRQTLRERMQKSPLMDGPGFARDVEAVYRQIWRQFCASSQST